MKLSKFLSYEGYYLIQILSAGKNINFEKINLKDPRIALLL